jgi:signal transduction histidine kinase
MTQLSLRARFLAGILFCVGLTLVLLAFWAALVQERVEQGLLDDMMQTNLKIYSRYVDRRGNGRDMTPDALNAYRITSAGLPAEVAVLEPGDHARVKVGERLLQVLVADLPSGRVFITYDITKHERREALAWAWFILILAVMLILIILTARWASRSILAPVTALADRLASIDPRERNVRIGGEFSSDELAPIAASVDRFMERLDAHVEREQSFTATASHELRTPLAVIQGATEILTEQTRERPAAQKALTRIRRAASEMSEFIHALLMLSREAHFESEPGELCDVRELVPRVVEDQRDLLNGRAVELSCNCQISLRVQAPATLVTIVVGNLFRNAVAHTPAGTISCEIRGRQLSIRDSGTGIAREHIEQVFDRNFTTRPGGYGVGLYLTKRICDRYGWTVQLNSTPGGTTATVTF